MEKLEHFLELGGTKKDITLLVISGIALIASVCIGEDFAAGEVAFIMQLGGLLEELTVARARAGIEKLVHLTPQTARVITGGKEKTVPAEAADVGRRGQRHRRGHRGYRARRREVKELPHLIALSKRMMRTSKLNITFSLTLNFIAIVLAIIGTLNPDVGALVHNAGSVLVITNSALLLKWRRTASQSFASAGAKSV